MFSVNESHLSEHNIALTKERGGGGTKPCDPGVFYLPVNERLKAFFNDDLSVPRRTWESSG